MATQYPSASDSIDRGMTTKPATTGKILLAGLAAIVAAIVANLILRAILTPLLGLSPTLLPFQIPSIIFFTLLGTGLGLLVFLLIYRLSSNPIRTFTIVAIVALIISILPNLGLMANPSAAPFPGGTPGDFAVLIVYHIVAAIVFVGVLTAMLRR